MNVLRYAERPGLRVRRYEEPTRPTFPEYMNYNEPGALYRGRLYTDRIRIHERVGGEIVAPAPASMTISAPAAVWEEWIGMRFPEDGEHVFPGGLAMFVVRDGIGTHVEPNVWLRHRL